MVDTHRIEVEQALAEWREAERVLEETPLGDPERPEIMATIERVRARYQQAVLESRGRIDQLEAAAESTWDLLQARSGRERAVAPAADDPLGLERRLG